jgi:magnesium transporter
MRKRRFPTGTAGRKIITAFPRVQLKETIRNVERIIATKAKTFDIIDYVYIIDEGNVLQGVISIKDVLDASNKDLKVEEIMVKKLVVAHPLTPQERVVYLALSNNLKAIPVIDKGKHLLGIVPYDTILRIFNEEVRKDTFMFGGIFHKVGDEYTTIKSPATIMVKRRAPWMILGILGGTITASIITSFEHVLTLLLTLAAFTPVLAYLSDAVGTQSETLAVRSIALDPKLSLKSYFLREVTVAFSLASVCGLLLFAVAMIGWHSSLLALIVGVSMFLSIIAAVLISTLFPFLFKRLNIDPAFASGPLATMIGDIATITLYFGVATSFLTYFGLL